MKRDREFHRAKWELAPSPVIHWRDFHTLTSQPRGELKRGDDGGSRAFGDRNRVSDMVAVTMTQENVTRAKVFRPGFGFWVPG